MAEIVEYRLEKSTEELNLLVELKLFTREQVKEILAKRESFEYALRKRNRSKLDFLKYIKYEINFLESLDKYKKTVLTECYKAKKSNKIEDLERRILLLRAKKLNDIIRSRCAHISSLFRKLTTSFQLDKNLWLAYIDFTKSRNFNTRTTALYWRLLRVVSNEPDIWIAAANHEVEVNKAYDTARGLYLRALRHHPSSWKLWAQYFKMELHYLGVVDQRSRIISGTLETVKKKKEMDEDNIWKAVDLNESDEIVVDVDSDENQSSNNVKEPLPVATVVNDDDKIMLGHLAKVVLNNAMETLTKEESIEFFKSVVSSIIECLNQSKGLQSIKEHIQTQVESWSHLPSELIACCYDKSKLDDYLSDSQDDANKPAKKVKRTNSKSKMDLLYEQYESNGIDQARKKFTELEQLAANKKLSLYVGMIQIELWELEKVKSPEQLNRIRTIYDKALVEFGKTKPKLWYEYIKFENDHAKTLDDFERINQLYNRAQMNLHSSKVDKLIEKYNSLQTRDSGADIEYSDYSDLDD